MAVDEASPVSCVTNDWNTSTTTIDIAEHSNNIDLVDLSKSTDVNTTKSSDSCDGATTVAVAVAVAVGGLVDYPYPSGYGWSHIIVSSIVVTTIMLVIVLGNALVVIAVAVDRNLKGPQNWFIASLAVSDLLVGLFIMPLSLSNELLGFWPFGAVLCQLWLATDVLLCTASILNLCLISLDRYWSIVRAVAYLRQRTPRRATLMICAVWSLSAVICFPPLAGWSRPQPVVDGRPQCVLSEEPGYVVYSNIGSFYLPLGVMVAVYIKIYMAARWRARRHLAAGSMMSTKSETSMGCVKTVALSSSLKQTVDDQRHPSAHKPQSASFVSPSRFLSPNRHGSGPQRNSLSVDFDSEPADEQPETSKCKTDSVPAADSDVIALFTPAAVANEMLTIVVMDQNCQNEQVCADDDVILPNDVIFTTANDKSAREELDNTLSKQQPISVTNLEQAPTSAAEEWLNDVSDVASLGPRHCGDSQLPMTISSDSVVVVVIADVSPAIKSTTPRMTSAASLPKINSVTSAADVINIRSRRRSSTSSFLTISTTCSPKKCVVPTTASGKNGGIDEKLLAVSAVRDYQSTRTSYGICGRSGSVSPGEDESLERSGSRPHRRLRASWTSAATRRRLNLAMTRASSGRRGAKAEGLFADTERAKRKTARARERRATIVLGIVMASFIGCWLPFFAVYPVALLTGAKVPGPLFGVIFWLGYCNSALNPIIYTVFNRDFRRAFHKIIVERIVARKSSSWVWHRHADGNL